MASWNNNQTILRLPSRPQPSYLLKRNGNRGAAFASGRQRQADRPLPIAGCPRRRSCRRRRRCRHAVPVIAGRRAGLQNQGTKGGGAKAERRQAGQRGGPCGIAAPALRRRAAGWAGCARMDMRHACAWAGPWQGMLHGAHVGRLRPASCCARPCSLAGRSRPPVCRAAAPCILLRPSLPRLQPSLPRAPGLPLVAACPQRQGYGAMAPGFLVPARYAAHGCRPLQFTDAQDRRGLRPACKGGRAGPAPWRGPPVARAGRIRAWGSSGTALQLVPLPEQAHPQAEPDRRGV